MPHSLPCAQPSTKPASLTQQPTGSVSSAASATPCLQLQFGDYYRPLAPGTYSVTVSKRGYAPASAEVTVPEDGSGVHKDWVLEPLPTEHKPAPTAAAWSAMATAGYGSALLQPRVGLVVAAALAVGLVLAARHRNSRLARLRRGGLAKR